MLMDIYYVEDPAMKGKWCPPWLSVFKSWDGSLYAETNVKAAAGGMRSVQNLGGVAYVDRHIRMCSPVFIPGGAS